MEDSYVLQLTESKFRDLYLCFCGMAECKPDHSYGPAVRPNYIIHYILSGKGSYQVGEQYYELQKGQGFLIEPETVTFYKADKEHPWTYCWIGFAGEMAPAYIRDVGLNSQQLVFQNNQGEELKKIVLRMLKCSKASVTNQYLLQSLLYEFFAILTKDIQLENVTQESKESIYIRNAINFIRNNYASGITVSDIAREVCVNRSYLYKLFTESLQMSPKEFITQFRISRSKELLTVTELSVEEVANSCGYPDSLVFSKAFKKIIGMPPSVYRKTHRKEVKDRLLSEERTIDEMMEAEELSEMKQRRDED
ncbi:MAG: AraC family transcriptional regulator [Lachnospiraceae bacterium]|nr:AraC family transcriptional regulator [Lachnospiraceae bacterium]